MSSGAIIGIVVGVIFVGGVILSSISKHNDVKKIKNNMSQTTCKVISRSIPKKSSDTHYGTFIKYEYTIDGKRYEWSKKYFFPKDDTIYFVGQTFPLVYCTTEPEISRILILDVNFEEFDLPQPDSLKIYNGVVW